MSDGVIFLRMEGWSNETAPGQEENAMANTQVEEIFHQARQLPGPQRGAFLQRACGPDPGVRAMVDSLLRADEEAGAFMRDLDPTRADGDPAARELPQEQAGDQLGPYKLLHPIGEGGFGTVWMAEQTEWVSRRVALKVIKLGMDTKQVIARFEAERQALAMMDHPNIAKVFDAGSTRTGRPYFVMELVRGVPITEFCDANRLATRERLRIFRDVCAAVHHAHQKGVIHRDLKPNNILITLHDGKPVPKVIDFGIAKATNQRLTEKTLFTEHRQMVGTPQYMSPEQAEMSGLDVDSRSDIYALGVLLYELLTGAAPLDAEQMRSAGFAQMQRMIRDVDPPRPSHKLSTLGQQLPTVARNRGMEPGGLSRLLRGDLDWIVMKALEKDRQRRYESAAQFAADIARFLDSEPVEAAPPQLLYRFRKFARRHRAAVIATSLVIIALTLGAIFSAYFAIQAQARLRLLRSSESTARQNAEQAEAAAERAETQAKINARLLYTNLIRTAEAAIENGGADVARKLLDQAPPEERGWEWPWLHRQAVGAGQVFARHQRDGIRALAYAPDGAWLVSGGYDNVARLWQAESGQPGSVLRGHGAAITGVAFDPAGERIATCSADRTVRIWDHPSGATIATLSSQDTWLSAVAFDPTGRWLASAGGNANLRIWDAQTLEPVHNLTGQGHDVWSLDFSPDGSALATSTSDGRIAVWGVAEGRQRWTAQASNFGCWTIRYAPDGQSLAVGSFDNRVTVWDAATGVQRLALAGHNWPVRAAEYTPDGRIILTASFGMLRAYDAVSGEPLGVRLSDQEDLSALAVHPAGDRFALGGGTDDIRVWPTAPLGGPLELRGHRDLVVEAVHAPDGQTLFSVGADGSLRAWNLLTGENVWTRYSPYGGFFSVDLTPDGTRLATLAATAELQLWNAQTGEPVWRRGVTRGVRSLRISPDGRYVAAGCPRETVDDDAPALAIWDLAEGQVVHQLLGHVEPTRRLAFSPDGTMLVSTGLDGAVLLWDTAGGTLVRRWQFETGTGSHAAVFSPDGQRLYVGDCGGRITCFDIHQDAALRTFAAHNTIVGAIDISADGKRLITGAWYNPQVRFWNVATGDLLLEVDTGISRISEVRFLPQDAGFVAAGTDGMLRAWELETPLGADAVRRATARQAEERMRAEDGVVDVARARLAEAIEARKTGDFATVEDTLEALHEEIAARLTPDHPLVVRVAREWEWTRETRKAFEAPADVPADLLAQLAGVYSERRFEVDDGSLIYMHAFYPGRHALIPITPLLYQSRTIDGFRMEFVLEDGTPTRVIGRYSDGRSDASPRNLDQ
jgi:WD40 repeat protein/serine/threonine protein kinase